MARRARNPVPALVIVAVIPALVLAAVWRFAAARGDDPAPAVASAPASSATSAPGGGAGALTTPLLSLRRAPATLARDGSIAALQSALRPVLGHLNDSSCLALDVDGKPVVAEHEALALRPASNVKVVTAAVALDVLGADHRFTTAVRGIVGAGGVVQGNLWFVGGGDPVLADSWWHGPTAAYPQTGSTSLDGFADSIVAAGVTAVSGSVVGDASRFDSEYYAPSWSDSVKFVEGGPISALLVNDSREAIDRSSNDPVVGAATVLTELLRARGVQVAGAPSAGTAPDVPVVASVESQPLPAILAEMLTTSDNNTAELLLKEIGLKASGAGTREAGIAAVGQRLTAWGVPLDGVTLVDGSGLSDDDRLTCAALLGVLVHGSPDDAVGAGLPIADRDGGTLAGIFADTPAAGVLRAKTGTLGADGIPGQVGVKTLSGYLPLAGGGAVEFALLLNGTGIADQREYRPIWNDLVAAMETYPAGPSAVDLAPK